MTSVDLSSQQIKDSDKIFQTFEQPENIISLDLSDNLLKVLPDNLAIFKNLEYLDLTQNCFENYEKIGRSLSSLPKLSNLKIDLNTQENAYLILSQLPGLKFLNNESTTDDEIEFQDDKIEEKIEENANENTMNYNNKEQNIGINHNLNNDIQENDMQDNNLEENENPEHNIENEEEIDNSSLQNEIPNYNNIIQIIIEKYGKNKKETNTFYNSFQNVLKEQVNILNNLDESLPNFIYSFYVQQAKNEIYCFLQDKIIQMLLTGYDTDLINLLKNVNDFIKKIYKECINFLKDLSPKYESTINDYKTEIKAKEEQIIFMSKNQKTLNEKINTLETDLQAKEKKIEELNNANKTLSENITKYQSLSNHNNNQNFITSSSACGSNQEEMHNLIQNLNNQNDNIEPEANENENIINTNTSYHTERNRIVMQKNRQNFNEQNPISYTSPNVHNSLNINKSTNFYEKKNPKPIKAKQAVLIPNNKKLNTNSRPKNQSTNNTFNYSDNFSYQNQTISTFSQNNLTAANMKELKMLVGPVSQRETTIKNLLETINDIYNSKIQNDKKNQKNNQQKLTMEQFLYAYLTHKYGLKNLVVEYAMAIIKGIKDFSSKNAEILLFGKILKNEIEEQEILIINKLKETISDFLVYYFQNKYQYKSKHEILELVKKSKTSTLDENQWKGIINFLFSENPEDLQKLQNNIMNFIAKNNFNNLKGRFNNEINYQNFLQILIEFQIFLRTNYLKNFNIIFKNVDTDTDGVLNLIQFTKLVEMANVYNTREELEINTQLMIKTLDPYGTKTIIYNDIIDLWSKEMTVDEKTGEKISLLDKLSME